MSADHTPEIDGTSIVRLARGVKLRDDPVRGQTLLLGPERAFSLDEIAVAIMQAFDGERTLLQIAEGFAAEFDGSRDEILADLIAFVREFDNRRLLELRR